MIITKHLNKDLKQKRTEIVSRFHLSHTLQCLLLMGLRTKQELKKKCFSFRFVINKRKIFQNLQNTTGLNPSDSANSMIVRYFTWKQLFLYNYKSKGTTVPFNGTSFEYCIFIDPTSWLVLTIPGSALQAFKKLYHSPVEERTKATVESGDTTRVT